MSWKEKYAYKKLRKKEKELNRNAVLPNLNHVKNVVVIWQPSQKKAFEYLKEEFNQANMLFNSFCVFEENNEPETDNFFLTSNDLNWWGLPRREKTEEFFNQNFDLLLNVTLRQNLVLHYLTALTQAKFKIGGSPNEYNYFDLNINIGEKQDALFLAQQQIFYLRQLNKKTTV